MKLVRFGAVGHEIPGIITDDLAEVFDVRSITPTYDATFFAADGLHRLRQAVKRGTLTRLDTTDLRVAAPLERPGKIVCIGLNFRQHAAESGRGAPD